MRRRDFSTVFDGPGRRYHHNSLRHFSKFRRNTIVRKMVVGSSPHVSDNGIHTNHTA